MGDLIRMADAQLLRCRCGCGCRAYTTAQPICRLCRDQKHQTLWPMIRRRSKAGPGSPSNGLAISFLEGLKRISDW